jgi:hypothetical protein
VLSDLFGLRLWNQNDVEFILVSQSFGSHSGPVPACAYTITVSLFFTHIPSRAHEIFTFRGT